MEDGGQDCIGIGEDFRIPEAHHHKSHCFEDRCPFNIVRCGAMKSVLAAVQLDDQAMLQTGEIDDEPIDRDLALELQTIELPVPQLPPELPFGIG